MRAIRRNVHYSAIAVLLIVGIAQPALLQEKPQVKFKNPALEEEDEFADIVERAWVLEREGKHDDAVKEVKKALKIGGDHCAECYRSIGEFYFRTGEYKEAASAFRRSLEVGAEHPAESYNWLGVSLYMQRDKKLYPEAIEQFRQAIDLSEGRIVLAYYNLGYTLLRTGRIDEGIAALERYLELDPGTNREAEVRTIIGNPAFANETFAPGFKVHSLEGEELSLDRYRGRVVLLDFWATWCGPCRFEMPGVKKMWKKYGGDDFIIIGINSDRHLGTLRKYLESEGIDWPQYFDEGNKIAGLYNVTGIPHTVLIDEFGIVRGVGYRGGKLEGKVGDLVKKLRNKQKQAAASSGV